MSADTRIRGLKSEPSRALPGAAEEQLEEGADQPCLSQRPFDQKCFGLISLRLVRI